MFRTSEWCLVSCLVYYEVSAGMKLLTARLWSFYVGRAATLSVTKETPLPTIDERVDARIWDPQASAQHALIGAAPSNELFASSPGLALPGYPRPGWVHTNFVWTCKLSALAERVLSAV
jgi:hypothetical protein